MGSSAGAIPIVGGVIGTIGGAFGDQAESRAHRRNASFYREQSEFARQAMLRELEIYEDQSADFTGEQISQISSGGVDMSGSPILAMATTFWRQEREREAILFDGGFKQREAELKAQESDRAADWLNSGLNASFSVVGGFLSGVGTAAQMSSANAASGTRSGGAMKTTTKDFSKTPGGMNPSSAAKYWSTA